MQSDQQTAEAFATSWNNLPSGSVYTESQVLEWFEPLTPADIKGRSVLEMGCGNASLMEHVLKCEPRYLLGIDLGASVDSARKNLERTGLNDWEVQQADLTMFQGEGFDIVYSIGVLHHLKNPDIGFNAVLKNVVPGGRFHCWVYAWEGNWVIRWFVEPIRRIASRLPWWLTKYFIATPLAIPYFAYAKLLIKIPRFNFFKKLPLYEYSLWIAQREFTFFRHVAFDQLVTPQTMYIKKETIEHWLNAESRILPNSTYIIMRNGNSWKFGGVIVKP